MIDSILERTYWISQVTLPFIAIGAAWIAIKQVRSFRLFELMKHIEDPRVREARRVVTMEIPQLKGQNWWTDQRLHDAATTLAGAYDVLGSALQFDGLGRVGRFFLDGWGEGIVRTHVALDDLSDVPSHVGSAQLYRFHLALPTRETAAPECAAAAHLGAILPGSVAPEPLNEHFGA